MARDAEHSGSADPSGNDHGQSLSDCYLVALEYIDPSLTAASTLEEILRAARRRQEELRQRPLEEVGEQLSELNEALLFAQRVLKGPQYPMPGATPAGGPAEAADEPAPAGDSPERETLFPEFSAGQHAEAAQLTPGITGSPPDATDEHDREEPVPADDPSIATAAIAGEPPRRPTLREVMAQARASDLSAPRRAAESSAARQPPTPSLPETTAWPVLLGLVLIAWQVWLALFSGWTVTRFFTWPDPVNGLQLGWLAAAGLLALGLLVAIVVGSLSWRYRARTRRLTLLVNLSALAIALDLLAWWWAVRKLAQLDGPHWWHAALLVLAWAVALGLARLHDAAAKPAR